MKNQAISPSPDTSFLQTTSAPVDSWFYEIHPSKPLPVVDLSRTPARWLLSEKVHDKFVSFMRSYFRYMEYSYRLAVVGFVVLLFVNHGAFSTTLLVLTPFMTAAVYCVTSFLSLDLIRHILRSYDFWFMTVFTCIHWSTLGFVLGDPRALVCIIGYLSTTQAKLVDANLRNAKTIVIIGLLDVFLFAGLTTLVTWQNIADQKPFDIVINGRKQGDAGDVLAFTTSTFAVFLVKLAVVKQIRMSDQSGPGIVTVPCATIKSVLRLVPKSTPLSNLSPLEALSLPRQRLHLRDQKPVEIDGLNTILPYKYWRHFLSRRRRLFPVLLRLVGITGYVLVCVQNALNFHRLYNVSVGKPVDPIAAPSHIAVFAFICTSGHCCGFVLLYQRDLLRDLVTRFDFLFTSIQFLIFSLCMCDAAFWHADMVLVLVSFNLWLLWTLTLDALTPHMKRLLGFSKRHIIHISTTVLLSCVGILCLIFFTQTNPLRDRVLWSHQVSPTHTITLRVQAILIGRIITILLWCSRQTVSLLLREEDELQSIHGVVVYDNPYESFPAPRKCSKIKTQHLETLT